MRVEGCRSRAECRRAGGVGDGTSGKVGSEEGVEDGVEEEAEEEIPPDADTAFGEMT